MSKNENKGSIFSRLPFQGSAQSNAPTQNTHEDDALDALMEEDAPADEPTAESASPAGSTDDEFELFMASLIESMDNDSASKPSDSEASTTKEAETETDDDLGAILASYVEEMENDGESAPVEQSAPVEESASDAPKESLPEDDIQPDVEIKADDIDAAAPEVALPKETAEAAEADAETESEADAETEIEDDAEAETEADNEAEDEGDAEIDEDAATLLAAMGYSEAEAAASPKSRRQRPLGTAFEHTDLSMAFGYDGQEYSSHKQTRDIKDSYAQDRLSIIVRLGASALFVLLLFIYDTFGEHFGGPLSVALYPTVNILIALQILLISAAFSFKQLFSGLRGVFKAEPTIHSISAVAVILTVIYDIILAILAPTAFTLYNLPAAVCLLFGAGYDFFVIEREMTAFARLASWQSVATFERVDSVALASELGESRIGEEDGDVGAAFRIRKAPLAANYFRYTNQKLPSLKVLNFIIAPVIALSLVIFIVSLAASRTVVDSLNIFIAINLFAFPAFMLVSMSFPFMTLIKKKLDKNAIILSEAQINEYADVDTVVLDEDDVFDETSLTINRMSVCDKSRMDQIFEIMCGVSSLYDKVGGRIAGAFRASTSDSGELTDASIVAVCDGGIEGVVAGRNYCVGSESFLTQRGISVMRYYDDKYLASNPGGVVLHIAVDGTEVFKLYLSYTIPDKTLGIIDRLSKFGTRLVMRCVDPNINEELLSRLIGDDIKLALIRKPYTEGEPLTASVAKETVSGGILVDGEENDTLIDAVAACKVYRAYSKLSFYVSAAIIAIGVLLSAFLGALGALIGMSSLYIVLFQLLSALPSILLAKLLLE